MRKHTRRKQRVNQEKTKGKILITFVLLIIVATFLVFVYQKNRHIEIDQNTLCPTNKKITSETAVLIDETDPLNSVQLISLKNQLQKIRDEIPLHGKVEIYLIGETSKNVLKPIISICNPGSGKEANQLYQNPKRIQQRWNEAYAKPIEKVFESLSKVEGAKRSPIMEAIQSISVTSFSSADNQDVQRHLIIASDMLQFSDKFNLYHTNIDHPQKINLNDIKSDLRNIKINILLFHRSSANQFRRNDLINFWNSYLEAQGATIERIYAITG